MYLQLWPLRLKCYAAGVHFAKTKPKDSLELENKLIKRLFTFILEIGMLNAECKLHVYGLWFDPALNKFKSVHSSLITEGSTMLHNVSQKSRTNNKWQI